ncbi:hypothetical protein A9Q84_05040 [Halobacteriovorax marinus]|uniref:DUF2029 domain-containing protein n=1 Tax=Halobacteriovorax marinus TaxID=97084 RepID=A0A1Y5FAQ7_9BACT|nr:hypothetical protein A9Q84_05040 [Halobacteriovorax marinus]
MIQNIKPLFTSLFPVSFILLLGYSLRRTHGFIKTSHLIYISLGLMLLVLHHFKNQELKISEKFLAIIYAIFSFMLTMKPDLFYAESVNGIYLLQLISGLNFIYSLILVFKSLKGYDLKSSLRFAPIFIGLFVIAHALVPLISPNPGIDVFTVTQEGADYLLKGVNPYASKFSDIFGGRYGYVAGYVYWPGILLTLSPFKWIFGDVRFFYILAQIITLFGISKLARSKGVNRSIERFMQLIWLSFPVTFFVLEQTWTENLIIVELTLLFLFLQKRNFPFAAITLGVLCATKQYNIFLAILVYAYIFKVLDLRELVKFFIVSVLSALVLFAPFILWDHQAFIQTTLTDILSYEPRRDALSWAAWIFHHQAVKIPTLVSLVIYLTPTIFGCYRILKTKSCELRELILWLVVSYGAIFLFGKQAFCNYYYLIAFLVLIYSLLSIKSNKVLTS